MILKGIYLIKNKFSFLNCSFRTNANNNPTPPSNTYNPQQQNIPVSAEGQISRTFRALEQDLSSVQGTGQVPMSVFEQRRLQQQQRQQQQQQNPAGFRSVRPPEEVPPDQQRRPYHTEYQVEHVQEKWLEPKLK